MKHLNNRIAFVDCDGVLADFVKHAVKVTEGRLTKEDIKTFYIEKCMLSNEALELNRLMNTQEWWFNIPVMDGAQEGMLNLLKSEYDVICLTSPYVNCKGWFDVRLEWLNKHFGIHHSDVTFSTRKDFYSTYNGDILIDDKPEHIENILHKKKILSSDELITHIRPIIFDAAYNRHIKSDRLHTWNDIIRFI